MGWFTGSDSSDAKTAARRKLNEAILSAVGDTNGDTEYFKERAKQRTEEQRLLLKGKRDKRLAIEAARTRLNLMMDHWQALNGPVAAEEYPTEWSKKAFLKAGPRFLAMMSDIMARRASHGRALEQKADNAAYRRAQGAIADGFDLGGDCTLASDFEDLEKATGEAARDNFYAQREVERTFYADQTKAATSDGPTEITEPK